MSIYKNRKNWRIKFFGIKKRTLREEIMIKRVSICDKWFYLKIKLSYICVEFSERFQNASTHKFLLQLLQNNLNNKLLSGKVLLLFPLREIKVDQKRMITNH